MSENDKLDETLLENLDIAQAKFVVRALVAAGHTPLWAANKAIEIASTFAKRDEAA